ncbi:MAG: ferritin-like domain-containing protein [Alphaproteobacteria bacterium]|nr:ferritin-like domain-containing protein [Alphaproteobacteria bacterium]
MRFADIRPGPVLVGVSHIVWRLPGRPATKMAEFAHTELGSGHDMLEACELTPRPEMRPLYFLHALDELRHSRMFRERARALAIERSRTQAVLDDSGYLHSHGIRGSDPLFTELGELDFLAFVWLHEQRGAAQFGIYAGLMDEDPASREMFARIEKDERFHIAYSRKELERLAAQGQASAVSAAVWRIRWRRFKQGWLRFSRLIGDTMAKLWLTVIYVVGITPFALIAKLTEREQGGLVPAEVDDRPAAQRALEQL